METETEFQKIVNKRIKYFLMYSNFTNFNERAHTAFNAGGDKFTRCLVQWEK